LKCSVAIDNLFKQGYVYRSHLFDILYKESSEKKVLFAVSRNVETRVKKNRMKRLLKEMYRLNQHDVPDNYHLAIIAKQKVFSSQLVELNREFQKFLIKLSVP
jgi:ribonuclease P protein component